ncbi:MAG: DUF4388 domain-containing protein [Planctomycetes bacterium]|nr:DUF4388 domain-containing protein [Planctomycetota bacterium]
MQFPASAANSLIEGYCDDFVSLAATLAQTLEQVSMRGINFGSSRPALERIERGMRELSEAIHELLERGQVSTEFESVLGRTKAKPEAAATNPDDEDGLFGPAPVAPPAAGAPKPPAPPPAAPAPTRLAMTSAPANTSPRTPLGAAAPRLGSARPAPAPARAVAAPPPPAPAPVAPSPRAAPPAAAPAPTVAQAAPPPATPPPPPPPPAPPASAPPAAPPATATTPPPPAAARSIGAASPTRTARPAQPPNRPPAAAPVSASAATPRPSPSGTLKGTNQSMPLLSVFQFLGRMRKSGTVHVQIEDETLAFEFVGGCIEFTATNKCPVTERLGELLVELNFTTREALAPLLAKVGVSSAHRLGHLVIESTLCSNGQVLEALELQVKRRFQRACTDAQASYEFEEGRRLPGDGRIRITPFELSFEPGRTTPR